MVKKSKSFISCLLAVLMILTAVPLTFAEENDPLNYSYSSDYTYVTVTGCKPDVSGEVVVLAEHDGKPVKTIATQAFAYCNKIETVIISEGIETIEEYAFAECSSLKKVYVPKSVTEINVAAFKRYLMPSAKNLNVTVCGYPGSVAETFAKENGLSFENACKHTETEIKNAVEATCTKEGYTGDKVCKECGETVEAGKKIEKKSHTYDEGKITTPATCTKEGVKTFTCSVCGNTKTEAVDVDSTAHTPGEAKEENIVAATCSQEGSYDEVVRCTECNAEISREHKTAVKLAHVYDEWTVTTPATCKADGEKERHCKNCTYVEVEKVPASTVPHKYDKGEVTTPATCTKEGVKTFTCSVCGETKTEAVPVDPNAHTQAPAVKENEKAATCRVKGSYDSVVYCTECKTEIRRITIDIDLDPNNHTFGDWKPITESTCSVKGTIERVCSGCGETEKSNLELDLNAHTYDEGKITTPATCKKEGVKTFTCTGCGATKTEDVAVDPNAHTYDEGVITTAPTCSAKGVKTFTCKDCKATKTEDVDVDPNAHTYDEGIITTASTCSTKGVKTFTCKACKATKTEDVAVDPNAHTYDEGKITTPATCKKEGVKTFTCTGCGATKTEEVAVDPDAHTYDVGVVTTASTCSAEGTKTFICTGCGATKTEEVAVDPDAHTPAPAVKENEVAATCTVEGSYDLVVRCKECKAEISRETKTINPDPKNHVNGYIIVGEKTATCKEKGYTGDFCCVDCGETLEEGQEIPIDRFNHTGETETRNAKEATCTKDGYSGDIYCLGCGVRLERGQTISAFGHKDENKDGRCDTCGAEYYTHETCPCRCHKTGFDKFLFKLALFFQMLFDKNQICKCGDIHY